MLFYVRHGESQANVDKVFGGQRNDSPLTDPGKEQARLAGKEILTRDLKIDQIISSPLRRTRQTAAIIATTIGYDVGDITFDDRILEYDMGELSGTPKHSVTTQELVSAKGAESAEAFRDRILSFIKQFEKSEQRILFVSHAGVGRMIETIKEKRDPSEFYEVKPHPNAFITKVEL